MAERSAAIQKYRAMITRDGMDQKAHFLLGREYLKEQRFLEAAAEFRRTVELNPESTVGWRWLGEAYEKAGILKEAAAAWKTAGHVARKLGDSKTSDEVGALVAKLPAEFMNIG